MAHTSRFPNPYLLVYHLLVRNGDVERWKESPQFIKREKAALKWSEAVTQVTTGHVNDEAFEEVSKELNDQEIVELTAAIIAMNAWNRVNIAFLTVPGNYVSQRRK